jgi:hypothetical protein
MSCIALSRSLMLRIILKIPHPTPLKLQNMHGYYYYFSQYCYYFSRFQASSLIFLYHSSNLRFHCQVPSLYSFISQAQRPNFKVTLSHLNRIDLLVYSYTHQTAFSILSSEHSSLIFSSFRSEDALREGRFFEVD